MSLKSILIVAAIAFATVAVVNRVGALRSIANPSGT
jgi:hypothetical protein